MVTLVCCLCLISSGFANDSQPRKETEIKKIVKNLPANYPVVIKKTWGKSKDVSLKKLDAASLNYIERNLLDRYADVILFSETPKCYYVTDETGGIGVCDLNGKEIVPPVKGHIRVCGGLHSIMIGDACENDVWEKKVWYVVTKTPGTGAGHFQALLDRKTLHPIIPYGKYHDIQLTYKGTTSWYYVARLDTTGTLRWGVCDKDGEEILPCEYLSVRKEGRKIGIKNNGTSVGGKFVGSNDLTMNEVENMVENKISLAEERQRRLVNTFNSIGQAMIAAGTVMEQAGIGGDSSQSNSSTTAVAAPSGSYQQQYAHWERLAERHYHSLTNTGVSLESKSGAGGVTGGTGHLSTGNYAQMKKALREAQGQMAAVRRRASQAGVKIVQSKWETAVVNY